MANIYHEANYAEKQEALKKGKTFSMAEISDVLELIVTKQLPDSSFSDNECNLWSLICRKLDINY